jgi:hypothetical protein
MERPPKKPVARPDEKPVTPPDLEPPIELLAELPAEIARLREEAERQNHDLTEILTPRIEGHLITLQTVLDELVGAHRQIGDTMKFGINEDTRWTAVWEMSGRCLGLCNALLVQLREGFASETVPTLRAIHEAGQLLTVLAGPGEESLLRAWLQDTKYISAQKARAAEERIAKPFVQLMKEQGITLNGDPRALGAEIYDKLSSSAHNMRKGFAECVARPLSQFSYGRHPSPIQRAVHVEFASQLIEEVTMRIGSALATRFLGRDFYDNAVAPLLEGVKAVRAEMPIDPPTVRRLAADS